MVGFVALFSQFILPCSSDNGTPFLHVNPVVLVELANETHFTPIPAHDHNEVNLFIPFPWPQSFFKRMLMKEHD
jgi:hypothetical protein